MPGVAIYRVQDVEGRGPYRPMFSHRWLDAFGPPPPAPVYLEFGARFVAECGRPGETVGCGVRSPVQITRWFTSSERGKLILLGFNLVCVMADRIIAESPNQVLFASRRPFAVGARPMDWPRGSDVTVEGPR